MYELVNDFQGNPQGVFRVADGAWIPLDPANSDYQAYLAQLPPEKPAK